MTQVRTFHYTARTLDGKLVRGSMQAAQPRNVLDLLRSRALFVTAVDAENQLAERIARELRIGRVSHTALRAFFRSFATLVRAGVSIGQALSVTIERAADARLAEALRSVLADVEQGTPLSEAMSRRPADFPPLYVAMIAAGEAGGILDDVIERLAVLLERESALRKKVQTALAYPAIVMLAATSLMVFLIVKIVPMFAQLFDSFHVEMPLATHVLLRLGAWLAAPLPWLVAALGLPLLAFAVVRVGRHPAGALFIDGARLRLPVIGPLLQKAIAARVIRMLATLLRSGIDLVSALDAVVPVAGSPRFGRAFGDVAHALRAGEPLANAVAQCDVFDPMFFAFARVGEETGLLDEMLLKLAEYFESDVEAAIATLAAAIEPALIVILGSMVAFIVFSIFLPLYSLIGQVAQ
ncbi:MAG: type II secretion system F family protein [Candidatus Velthaea sp.]|jgi:type IV pilus assembly protein PilC